MALVRGGGEPERSRDYDKGVSEAIRLQGLIGEANI